MHGVCALHCGWFSSHVTAMMSYSQQPSLIKLELNTWWIEFLETYDRLKQRVIIPASCTTEPIIYYRCHHGFMFCVVILIFNLKSCSTFFRAGVSRRIWPHVMIKFEDVLFCSFMLETSRSRSIEWIESNQSIVAPIHSYSPPRDQPETTSQHIHTNCTCSWPLD